MISKYPIISAGRTGWPWTEESPQFPPTLPDGSPWPKISIVTPSYNQGDFLEETIRSVLLQGYPNLEYIIIDGGSTDNSVEIIKKYEPWLTYWVSELYCGQSHAINKGMARSTGEIVAWLCSDDYYLPFALKSVSPYFSKADWVLGTAQVVNISGELIKTFDPYSPPIDLEDRCFKNSATKDFATAQPGHFWSKALWTEIGGPNEKYHYCMDFEWMLRALSAGHHPVFIPYTLACLREQPASKTVTRHRKFGLEKAHIFIDLSRKGVLKWRPSLLVSLGYCRRYTYRNLYAKSDEFNRNGRLLSSLMIAALAWLISPQKVGWFILEKGKVVKPL